MELLFDNTDTLKEYLNSLLESSTIEIEFTKADGTNRVMQCTKDHRILPVQTPTMDALDSGKPLEVKQTKTPRKPNPGVLVVFDVENNGWRSITLERIKSITAGKFTLGITLGEFEIE